MSTRTIPTEENGRVTLADVVNRDKRFRYMLLSRLQSDCDYYLHYGGAASQRVVGWRRSSSD
jgi:hypothetical protein